MAADASQSGIGSPGAPTSTLQPGEKLGHLRIVEQVGAGGSSIVYRAHDDLLDRDLAVKQVRPTGEGDDDERRRRVKGEAQAQKRAAAANPDRLVQLVDVIDDTRGLLLVSEYIDGASLEEELTRDPEPMDIKQAVGILAATAQALEAIHQHRIIHRDLKPANILLPRAGGLKVADFGLATAMSEQQLMSVGSVRYMAPELLRGEDADGRADLYSLGLIAYEMLVGRRQFEQSFRMVLRDQRNQAMRWVKWHTNARAKVAPVRDVRPDVPEAIAELVDRLMEKEPSRRVPSAHDVLEAIRRHYAGASGQPTAPAGAPGAAPPTAHAGAPGAGVSGGGDTAPLPKRSRLPVILAGILVFWLLVAGGLGGYVYLNQNSELQRRQQQATQTLNSATEAYRNGQYAQALDTYARIAEQWPAETGIGGKAHAGVLLARSRVLMEDENHQAARDELRQLMQLDLGAINLVSYDHVRNLLDEAEKRANFAEAVQGINDLIEQQAFAEARRQLREWHDLALRGEEEARLRELSEKLEDQRSRYERDQVLARVDQLLEQNQRAEAIELLSDTLERSPSSRLQARYDELTGRMRYDNAIARAEAAEAAGALQPAIEAYERAQQIRETERVQGKLDELRSRAAFEEGQSLLAEGRTGEAEAAFTRSLRYQDNPQAREALQQIESSNRRAVFVRDGDEAFNAGDYDAAVKQYRNAQNLGATAEVQEKLERARQRDLIQDAREAIKDNRFDEAEQMLNEAMQLDNGSTDALSATREALQTHRQYHQHLTAGDAGRERSDFGRAKDQYRKAQDIMDTEQVRQRLAEAEYADAIAKARAYLSVGNYNAARSWVNIAASERDTEEVRKLREEIESAAESS